MLKVLITGASGFIGTNLLEVFREKYEVRNLDIMEPRNKSHISFWRKVDITNYSDLSKAVIEFAPDYVVHLAARTDIRGNKVSGYSANTVGVENLIKVCNTMPHLKKIIFTSSMLVSRVGYRMRHICDYMPPNAYGESKVQTERIIREEIINADWAILRPTSIWGEWFDTYRDFFEMVMSGKYMHFGEKSSTKTYGYVGNSVYQIEQLMLADTTDWSFEDKVFYIGDKPAYFIEDWANEIAQLAGKMIPRLPFGLIKCAAWFGDILKVFGIGFPMTSFRLKNMTTDNIIDVEPIFRIAPNPPFSRIEATKRTVDWIRNTKH